VLQFLLEFLGSLTLLVAGITAYEVLRASLLRGIRLRLERSVSRWLQRHRVRLDRFKFTQKHYIREALLNDPALGEWILRHSQETGQAHHGLRLRAEWYIEEIVPYFSLVSYYKLGYGIARPLMAALYDVVWSRDNLRAAQALADREGAVVFVINHRSNADFVLFAVCQSRNVALSYAVGEWARVWPLETLFKSFGSYFVRRGERDPLYHEVLRRYLQLVTAGGLTQGIFIEGGLTRDGRLRKPKVGLLDNLLGVLERPEFRGDVWFVPVGLNFDRVLEDSYLLREAQGKVERPGPVQKAQSLGTLLLTLPPVVWQRALRIVRGAWRLARKRRFSFGVAAVHAGPPVGFREYFGARVDTLRDLSRAERKEELQRFADHLLERIGREVPVTSVPVFAAAVERAGGFAPSGAARGEVVQAIRDLLAGLRSVGAPVMLGRDFAGIRAERAASDEDLADRGGPMVALQGELLGLDEAEGVFDTATAILARRRAIRQLDGRVRVFPEAEELIRYYAYSIEPHLERMADRAPRPSTPSTAAAPTAALDPPEALALQTDPRERSTEPGARAAGAAQSRESADAPNPAPDAEPPGARDPWEV
jgi:glycerol-3-phosphate O-acyltransferase